MAQETPLSFVVQCTLSGPLRRYVLNLDKTFRVDFAVYMCRCLQTKFTMWEPVSVTCSNDKPAQLLYYSCKIVHADICTELEVHSRLKELELLILGWLSGYLYKSGSETNVTDLQDFITFQTAPVFTTQDLVDVAAVL